MLRSLGEALAPWTYSFTGVMEAHAVTRHQIIRAPYGSILVPPEPCTRIRPTTLLASAIAGGIFCVFRDEERRYKREDMKVRGVKVRGRKSAYI